MKKYEADLKEKLKQAERVALAGLGFAIVAQRKVEKAARELVGKSGSQRSQLKEKAKRLVDEALKEQKIAQKKVEAETKKALAMVIKESKKQLNMLEGKLGKKGN